MKPFLRNIIVKQIVLRNYFMRLHHSTIKDWRTPPFVQAYWFFENSINALNLLSLYLFFRAVKTWRECRFQPSHDEGFSSLCLVADTDDDHRKEGVDGDPEIRKNHDDEADGQNPEDCQEDIQRHPFSWKFVVKVQSSLSCMRLCKTDGRWGGGQKNVDLFCSLNKVWYIWNFRLFEGRVSPTNIILS